MSDEFEARLNEVLVELRGFLLEKNAAYGNSASDPVRIFSKASREEQLRVRIDDKLSRMMRGHEFDNDDTLKDLLGYLVILEMTKKPAKAPASIDDATPEQWDAARIFPAQKSP